MHKVSELQIPLITITLTKPTHHSQSILSRLVYKMYYSKSVLKLRFCNRYLWNLTEARPLSWVTHTFESWSSNSSKGNHQHITPVVISIQLQRCIQLQRWFSMLLQKWSACGSSGDQWFSMRLQRWSVCGSSGDSVSGSRGDQHAAPEVISDSVCGSRGDQHAVPEVISMRLQRWFSM